MTAAGSAGRVAAGFEPVRDHFDAQLAEQPGHSAQLAVQVGGRWVVDLWGGPHLGPTSVTGVYSATKGIAAIAVATLVRDGTLDLDEPVAARWPEFAAGGKAAVTVRQLLSHQAGLVNTREGLTSDEFYDSPRAASLLAATRPTWHPGAAFGYHALTIGPLVEELVRRVAGTSLQDLYERRVRRPRGIDFFLGLPGTEEPRYVDLLPWTGPPADDVPTGPPVPEDGFPAHALGLDAEPEAFSPNSPRARAQGSASIGGVGSARGLAQAYAAATTDEDPLLDPGTVEAVSQLQVDGPDLVLGGRRRFGVLFMKPWEGSDWGSFRAFGHDGAAGALGFADPAYRVAFGYIPLPAPPVGGADRRAVDLSLTVRACVRRLGTSPSGWGPPSTSASGPP